MILRRNMHPARKDFPVPEPREARPTPMEVDQNGRPIDPKRRTGRTTRMMQEAVRLASFGHPVICVFQSSAEAAAWVQRAARYRVVCAPLSQVTIDWDNLRVRDQNMTNYDLLVDHHIIERRFGRAFEMMTRFDQPQPPAPFVPYSDTDPFGVVRDTPGRLE